MNSLTSTILAALSPPPTVMAAEDLPPVETMRFERRPDRESSSGTATYYGDIQSQDENAATKGSLWYGSMGNEGISGKMMNSPHVKASVGYGSAPLQGSTWRYKRASASPRDIEVADFCNHTFLECLPWDSILRRMVDGGTKDGFHLAEMTDDLRAVSADRFPHHPRPSAALVPTGIHEIPANTVDRWFKSKDNATHLDHITQWQPYSDEETGGYREVNADRIIRYTVGQSGSNFAGIPELRAVYGSWMVLLKLELYRAMVFERTAMGTPIVTQDDGTDLNKEEIAAIETLLENMRAIAKGAGVLPPGCSIEWSGAGENDANNLNIAIEAIKTDIAINMTAGFSRLGLVGPGSYALANTQSGQYHLSTVGRATLVSDVFTLGADGWSPTKRIVEANYGVGTPIPILEARNLPTRDIKTTIPLVYTGIQNKLIRIDDQLEEDVRDALDVGPHDPTTARTPAPAPGMPPPTLFDNDDPEEEDNPDE